MVTKVNLVPITGKGHGNREHRAVSNSALEDSLFLRETDIMTLH